MTMASLVHRIVWIVVGFIAITVLCNDLSGPVVFIAGSPSSVIQVTLREPKLPSGCPTTGSFIAYPNKTFQALQDGLCFVTSLSLVFDDSGAVPMFRNVTGVDVSVRDDLTATEGAPLFHALRRYFPHLTWNKNFFLVAYDWRLPPHLDVIFQHKLRAAVEHAAALNGGRRVHIVAHSTGPSEVLGFLLLQPQPWKDKYVASFVSLSGNYGGEIDLFDDVIDTSESAFDGVDPSLARLFWWSQPSEAWQFPHPDLYVAAGTLVRTPSYNYTAADAAVLLRVAGAQPMLRWFETHPELYNFTWGLPPPQVNTHCLYGEGVRSVAGYVYENDFFVGAPQVLSGDGDGGQDITTNRACLRWAHTMDASYTFAAQGFPGVSHMQMLDNAAVVAVVVQVLSA